MKLHDLFIVKIKKEFMEASPQELMEHIPEKYHIMFTALWNEFQSLEEILDQRNFYMSCFLCKELENLHDNVLYYHPDRNESLQVIILDKFCEKLLVMQNIYNNKGHNIIYLVEEGFIANISFKKNDIPEGIPAIGDMNKTGDDVFINLAAGDIISWDEWNTQEKDNKDEEVNFNYDPAFFKQEKKKSTKNIQEVLEENSETQKHPNKKGGPESPIEEYKKY